MRNWTKTETEIHLEDGLEPGERSLHPALWTPFGKQWEPLRIPKQGGYTSRAVHWKICPVVILKISEGESPETEISTKEPLTSFRERPQRAGSVRGGFVQGHAGNKIQQNWKADGCQE